MTDIAVERDNDSLCTPEWILERVRKVHPIGLDPASNPWSTVGARISYSLHRGEDGLSLPWEVEPHETIWINCPYSDPLPWCQEIATHGSSAFVLVKNDPSTRWSAYLRGARDAQCDFTKRIRFEGGAHATGMFASTLYYMGPSPYLFCHHFQDVGDVRVFGR